MKPHRMIVAARTAAGQTQQELADRLTEVTGDPWTRNGVAAIEHGRRKFSVDDLEAFAEAQGVEVSWYLDSPISLASEGTRPYLESMAFRQLAAA